MNTSPIDSYEQAAADGAAVFTWANNEFMVYVMVIIGFAFSIWALYKFVVMEKGHLDSAAARLAGKYRSAA